MRKKTQGERAKEENVQLEQKDGWGEEKKRPEEKMKELKKEKRELVIWNKNLEEERKGRTVKMQRKK